MAAGIPVGSAVGDVLPSSRSPLATGDHRPEERDRDGTIRHVYVDSDPSTASIARKDAVMIVSAGSALTAANLGSARVDEAGVDPNSHSSRATHASGSRVFRVPPSAADAPHDARILNCDRARVESDTGETGRPVARRAVRRAVSADDRAHDDGDVRVAVEENGRLFLEGMDG